MTDIDSVRNKLDEYGIEIYNDYSLSKDEYVFMVEKMAVFVNTKEHVIGISFQAETRPETASRFTLILKETEGIKDIDVMESFVVDENNKFVSGEKAFELMTKKLVDQVTGSIIKEQAYIDILMTSNCHRC